MIIETQRGKGKVKVEEVTLLTMKEQRTGHGILFGVSREKFLVLGEFASLKRAEEVYAELAAAYRRKDEIYRIPEA